MRPRAPYAFPTALSTYPAVYTPPAKLGGGNANSAGMWWQGSSYWLDLANNYGVWNGLPVAPGSLITDTHAQTIEANDTTGLYSAFAANVLVRTDIGLQTVPTRTNSLPNNSMVGATVGTIGAGGALPTGWSRGDAETGVATAITATGTEFGLPYIDYRVFGTTNSTQVVLFPQATTTVTAANGETWTASAFYVLANGATTNITAMRQRFYEFTAIGSYVTEGSTANFTPTTAFQRVIQTRTLSGGVTVARVVTGLNIVYLSGVAIDITLRIYAPQLEGTAVSYASPPILTTNAAVTVNGNQQVISGLTSLLAGGVGFIWQGNIRDPGSNYVTPLCFGNAADTSADQLRVNYNGGNMVLELTTASSLVASLNLGAWAQGLQTIVGVASTNYVMGQRVGSSAPSADTLAAYPAFTKLALGSVPWDGSQKVFQNTIKLGLWSGPQDAGTFNQLFARATAASYQ